jgi:hypothetical protein
VIVAPAVTASDRSLGQCAIYRAPLPARRAINRCRSAAAMIGTVTKSLIVFEFDERGKDLGP